MKKVTFIAIGASLALCSADAMAQCASPTPDAGEVVDGGTGTNDFCTDGSLPSIGEGSYSTYYVETDQVTDSYIDEDFWTIDVPNGETITVDIYFSTANADTDLFLYDAAVHTPCSALTTNLGQGFSTSDDEQVIWTNNTGSTVTTIIRVNNWEGHSGTQNCNTYDMDIDVTGGVATCGENSPNSVGAGASLTTAPSPMPGNTLFTASGLPSAQTGVLYYGDAPFMNPLGCGVRCVGGSTVRLAVTGTGAGSVIYDEAVATGMNAQYWYRDPDYFATCGDTFNFSNVVVVP